MKQIKREEFTMSEQKAFAQFPSTGGGYQYVDIFAIEAIGQGGTNELATIFTSGSDRYYLVEVSQADLDRTGEPDAASWCLSLVGKVARLSQGIDSGSLEADDEDDFTEPLTKSNGEWHA